MRGLAWSERSMTAIRAITPVLLSALTMAATGVPAAQAGCRFLMPLGGGGNPVVSKRIGPDRLVGRTNWNTDFVVDRDFRSYRFFFTSASTERASFPVSGFMVFTDGSSLQVINETPTFEPGTGRMFGPFQAVPGKRTRLMNFRVGSSTTPAALGFSYRISVQGCT
ncbi:hypothetical protein [Cyanobium sp. Copco_Reservoir_LC18]|uniref:hypothetical protein n=1 Tax=Cyanobium sp. Copco_Reservoir_LC18 TaxID=1328305 RepID=UPI001F240378|nr:hypothetical protein [Cyanobium sp. Copco_Reservoir_LC18]